MAETHDGDLVAAVHLALDALGDVADAVEVGDGRAAEFHHDARHLILFLGLGHRSVAWRGLGRPPGFMVM